MNRKCCLTNCNDNAWEGISSYCERHYMERQNKTCGEISCEECNERYEQALTTIDRLQSALSQAQEATARRCAEIATGYHHGGMCQITNRCRPCVIADAIRKEYGVKEGA